MSGERMWQVAAGERGRYYTDLFLQHDVIFLGPGDPGLFDFQTCQDPSDKVVRFCAELTDGDVVILREGAHAKAVGRVVEESLDWSEVFSDVHGWDLQHFRRVRWQDHLEGNLVSLQRSCPLFSKRGTTLSPVGTRVRESVLPLLGEFRSRELRQLPTWVTPALTDPQIRRALYSAGMAADVALRVVRTIGRLRDLQRWYQTHGDASGRPSEHEVVGHMVLPLLHALGWSEQHLSLEWHRIDLAAFLHSPTTRDSCVLVCEAKHQSHSLHGVRDQACAYLKKNRLHNVRKILTTCGTRLLLHQLNQLNGPDMEPKLAGYLNVKCLRRNHLIPQDTDAIATLLALTPANIRDPVRRTLPGH